MTQILVSLPDTLAARFKAAVPMRQRSKLVADLLAAELERRENELYQRAMAVEQDTALQTEMQAWDETLADGLEE